ncbi:MAG: hypothetical protein KC897_10165, partial [Candidatus Omnitrophica bacterium]|nr:hypothetical protein [Candidatus Omnitrophota bacterium]
MNNPAMIVGVIVFIVLTILMFEVLLLPEVKKRQKKDRKPRKHVPGEEELKLKEALERADKRERGLKEDVEEVEKRLKKTEEELTDEKSKVKKLQEKLITERGWHEKEA